MSSKRTTLCTGVSHDPETWYVDIQTSGRGGNLLEKLLLSQDCADVIFELTNGKRISAHKCVLAVASDPLKALVTGPWLENQNDKGVCIVKVEHSAAAIEVMLKFVYSNYTTFTFRREYFYSRREYVYSIFDEIFELAELYDFPELANACETLGISWLKHSNCDAHLVMTMTVAACEHERNNLRKACTAYIKEKGASIMMSEAFMAVKTSDPDVWKTLRKALGVPDMVV